MKNSGSVYIADNTLLLYFNLQTYRQCTIIGCLTESDCQAVTALTKFRKESTDDGVTFPSDQHL